MTDTFPVRPKIVLIAAVVETNRVGEPAALAAPRARKIFGRFFARLRDAAAPDFATIDLTAIDSAPAPAPAVHSPIAEGPRCSRRVLSP